MFVRDVNDNNGVHSRTRRGGYGGKVGPDVEVGTPGRSKNPDEIQKTGSREEEERGEGRDSQGATRTSEHG